MRPPINANNSDMTAMESRTPASPTSATPAAERWNSTLAANISTSPRRTGRLRQLRPATISFPTRTEITPRYARSATAVGTGPVKPPHQTAMRPQTQIKASAPSGQPRIGRRPVQLGTAVNTNPPSTAPTYPNIISWTCHMTGPFKPG